MCPFGEIQDVKSTLFGDEATRESDMEMGAVGVRALLRQFYVRGAHAMVVEEHAVRVEFPVAAQCGRSVALECGGALCSPAHFSLESNLSEGNAGRSHRRACSSGRNSIPDTRSDFGGEHGRDAQGRQPLGSRPVEPRDHRRPGVPDRVGCRRTQDHGEGKLSGVIPRHLSVRDVRTTFADEEYVAGPHASALNETRDGPKVKSDPACGDRDSPGADISELHASSMSTAHAAVSVFSGLSVTLESMLSLSSVLRRTRGVLGPVASPSVGVLNAARRRLGRRTVVRPSGAVRGGNLLYLWQCAHTRAQGGDQLRIVRTDPMAAWLEEFPLLHRLTIAPERIGVLDRREDMYPRAFGRDFSREANRQFCRDLVASSPRFQAHLAAAAEQISEDTVVVNVRRGDYYTVPEFTARFALDIPRHVEQALQEIRRRGRSTEDLLVISDDVPWCREHLAGIGPLHVLEHRTSMFDDLAALASARTIVLANSTFSYWGAYIAQSQRDDVLAVAPPYHEVRANGDLISPEFDPRWSRTSAR